MTAASCDAAITAARNDIRFRFAPPCHESCGDIPIITCSAHQLSELKVGSNTAYSQFSLKPNNMYRIQLAAVANA